MAWGSPDIASEAGGDDEMPPDGDIGNGHALHVNRQVWEALMHHPVVRAAVHAKALEVCDEANASVAMDPRAVSRLGKGEPAYKVTQQPDEYFDETTRYRERIKANNMLGHVDEQHNHTLELTLVKFQSDPHGLVWTDAPTEWPEAVAEAFTEAQEYEEPGEEEGEEE